MHSRVGRDEEGVRVGQAHDGQGGLHPGSGDLDDRFAEVELGLARWLGERHEHVAVTMVILGQVTPDAAGMQPNGGCLRLSLPSAICHGFVNAIAIPRISAAART